MRRVALALLVLVPLGCGGAANEDRTPIGNPPGKTTPDTQASREAAIYASVVRQLVTKDHIFGGADPGFKVIYVMDGVVKGAGDPDGSVANGPAEAFSETVKAELNAALADLPPLRFVASRDSVVVGTNGGSSPGHVKKGGVLISLGLIEGDGNRFEVGNSLWSSGLAGQWLTYVLGERDGVWKVTGTTGPIAIS